MSAEESIWSQTKTTAYQTTGYMHFNNLLCITSSCPVLLYSICMHYMPALLCSARLGFSMLCAICAYAYVYVCCYKNSIIDLMLHVTSYVMSRDCICMHVYMYVCIHMTMYLQSVVYNQSYCLPCTIGQKTLIYKLRVFTTFATYINLLLQNK